MLCSKTFYKKRESNSRWIQINSYSGSHHNRLTLLFWWSLV